MNERASSRELLDQVELVRVDAAIRDLGGRSIASLPMAAAPAVIPAELRRPVTWSGPLNAGTKVLANHLGYRLVITGQPNPGRAGVHSRRDD